MRKKVAKQETRVKTCPFQYTYYGVWMWYLGMWQVDIWITSVVNWIYVFDAKNGILYLHNGEMERRTVEPIRWSDKARDGIMQLVCPD